MSTADWALVVSLFSLAIALASFVWNVWSKFIHPKPRVDVSLMCMRVLGSSPPLKHLHLSFTNFGPGEVVINVAVARPIRPWYKRRVALGVLNPIDDLRRPNDPTGPFGGGLPKKLAVGESHTLYFPWGEGLFLKEPIEAIGVADTFRRSHWVPKFYFKNVVEKYREEFVTSS